MNITLKAVGKIVWGGVQVIGGVKTCLGGGLIGGYLRSRHMTGAAMQYGKRGIESGHKKIVEGLNELRGE